MAEMISAGAPLGATREYQPTDSNPGNPASSKVGTFGNFSKRVLLVDGKRAHCSLKRRPKRHSDIVDSDIDLATHCVGKRLAARIVRNVGHVGKLCGRASSVGANRWCTSAEDTQTMEGMRVTLVERGQTPMIDALD